MTTALDEALTRSLSVVNTARTTVSRIKSVDIVSGQSASSAFGQMQASAADRRRYGMFRGWLYSAINALSQEAAGQPVNVGRLLGANPNPDDEERRAPGRIKGHQRRKMTPTAKQKSVGKELELMPDHPLADILQQPNNIQGRWQFVYTFVANLNLTGWAYIVSDEDAEGNLEFYSLPTTWVTPVHSKTEGAFSAIKVADPNDPAAAANAEEIPRENFAMAYFPNPGDPKQALSPAQTQVLAVKIDDHIQSSQSVFFENGVFPSVVVHVGQNPIGPTKTTSRRRLSGTQRKQVYGAIRKAMSGVANYGKPAIVDGLIEKITRFSATQNEMGWEKSETAVRTRILSAFSVHPYILGEPVNVGGYAQAAKIEERFCKRVNTHLDMLSTAMTVLAGPKVDEGERTLVWWEECSPNDPALTAKNWQEARRNGDVTKNEYRAFLGLPPDESAGPDSRNKLLDSVGGINGAVNILTAVGNGKMTPESASQLLALFFELQIEQAEAVVAGAGLLPVEDVVDELRSAVKKLGDPIHVELSGGSVPDAIADSVLASARSIGLAADARDGTAKLTQHVASLQSSLDDESAERRQSIASIKNAVKQSQDAAANATEIATSKLLEAIANKKAGDDQTQMVKDVLSGLSEKLGESFEAIDGAIKQPVVVNVEAPDVTVSAPDVNVSPPVVNVTNEVNPAGVQITNQVETPEVKVNVEPTPVTVEAPNVEVHAPDVKVAAPDVTVNPEIKIDVQPAEVDVNISKDDAPKKATVQHPDGSMSHIQLEDGD